MIRNLGKTIILLLLVFILGTVIAGAISVKGAISNTDANLRARMQPIVSINWSALEFEASIDWDSLEEGEDPWRQRPVLTPAIIHAIGELSYVAYYDYMITLGLRSFELDPYSAGGTVPNWSDGEPNWLTLRGASRAELVQFEQGTIYLTQGRQFIADDLMPGAERSVAIVSEGFANENNLSVNSIIELSEFIQFPDANGSTQPVGLNAFKDENIYAQLSMEFEIIGLFNMPENPEHDPLQQDIDWSRHIGLNSIYVPNWALEDVYRRAEVARISVWDSVDHDMPAWMIHQMDGEENAGSEMTIFSLFVLENPAYINEFREVAKPLLPDDFHYFEDLSSSFDAIASSMETMQSVADWILYVSIGAILLSLSLLIILLLHNRRYEMGVYLALGEKKGKIISQISMEIVATSFIGMTLAVFAGHCISSTMSRSMLMNELQAQQNDHSLYTDNEWTVFDDIGIPTIDMSIDEMVDAFEVSLTTDTILLFYAIGLGAVVLSTIGPALYIVTLNPKKVLM